MAGFGVALSQLFQGRALVGIGMDAGAPVLGARSRRSLGLSFGCPTRCWEARSVDFGGKAQL